LSAAISKTPTAAPGPGSRLPALDGLRGLAVLLVLLDHASDAELRLFPAANMNRAGKYGVYLFFVLSAFLLTHLLLRRPPAELVQARTWIDYFLRRFLRIFPLYAFVLAALVLMEKLTMGDFFSHLLLLDGKKQFWTIPVEVKYYLVLPAVVLAISHWMRRQWFGGTLAATGALVLAAVIFHAEAAWSFDQAVWLARSLEPFLLGTAAALAHGALLARPGTARFRGWFEAAAVVALLATALRLPSIYRGLFPFLTPISKSYDPIVCGVLWTMVLVGMLHGTGFTRRLFETPVLRYLGLISYSAYLWHAKFLTDVDDLPVLLPLRLLVFLLLVSGVATVSYFLIERPLARLHYPGARTVTDSPPDAALRVT
jgi:peptidoglycan/LPS O-acetylase OafA/YrhL